MRVSFDSSVAVLVGEDCELRMESDVVLRGPGGEDVRIDPENPGDESSLLVGLVGEMVVEAVVGDSGELLVGSSTGVSLRVPPDAAFEAWGLVGPGEQRVICMPGGELAVWGGSTPPS